MNPITTALAAGIPFARILSVIGGMNPALVGRISTALSAGIAAKQIIGFLEEPVEKDENRGESDPASEINRLKGSGGKYIPRINKLMKLGAIAGTAALGYGVAKSLGKTPPIESPPSEPTPPKWEYPTQSKQWTSPTSSGSDPIANPAINPSILQRTPPKPASEQVQPPLPVNPEEGKKSYDALVNSPLGSTFKNLATKRSSEDLVKSLGMMLPSKVAMDPLEKSLGIPFEEIVRNAQSYHNSLQQPTPAVPVSPQQASQPVSPVTGQAPINPSVATAQPIPMQAATQSMAEATQTPPERQPFQGPGPNPLPEIQPSSDRTNLKITKAISANPIIGEKKEVKESIYAVPDSNVKKLLQKAFAKDLLKTKDHVSEFIQSYKEDFPSIEGKTLADRNRKFLNRFAEQTSEGRTVTQESGAPVVDVKPSLQRQLEINATRLREAKLSGDKAKQKSAQKNIDLIKRKIAKQPPESKAALQDVNPPSDVQETPVLDTREAPHVQETPKTDTREVDVKPTEEPKSQAALHEPEAVKPSSEAVKPETESTAKPAVGDKIITPDGTSGTVKKELSGGSLHIESDGKHKKVSGEDAVPLTPDIERDALNILRHVKKEDLSNVSQHMTHFKIPMKDGILVNALSMGFTNGAKYLYLNVPEALAKDIANKKYLATTEGSGEYRDYFIGTPSRGAAVHQVLRNKEKYPDIICLIGDVLHDQFKVVHPALKSAHKKKVKK